MEEFAEADRPFLFPLWFLGELRTAFAVRKWTIIEELEFYLVSSLDNLELFAPFVGSVDPNPRQKRPVELLSDSTRKTYFSVILFLYWSESRPKHRTCIYNLVCSLSQVGVNALFDLVERLTRLSLPAELLFLQLE